MQFLSIEVFIAIFVDVPIRNQVDPIAGGLVQEMQQAEHIDGTQEANSEQAVQPRYLIWRTNPRATQVETAIG